MKSIAPPDSYFLLVDNSPTIKLYRQLRNLTNVIYINIQQANVFQRIARSYEMIREFAISKHFKYWWVVECDIFPPPDAFARLKAHNLPAVTGTYMVQVNGQLKFMWGDAETDGTIRIMNVEEGITANTGDLQLTTQGGLGCALLEVSILDLFKFRTTDTLFHCDARMWEDLYNAGIKGFVDPTVHCRHEYSNWSEIYGKERKGFDQQ